MRSVLLTSLVALVAGACSRSNIPNFATGGFTVLLGTKTN